jgi:hypothetical protein
VLILKEVKVVCFDTLSEVLILKLDTAAHTDLRLEKKHCEGVCHPRCFRKRGCKLLKTKEGSAKKSAKSDKEAANC